MPFLGILSDKTIVNAITLSSDEGNTFLTIAGFRDQLESAPCLTWNRKGS